MAELRCPNCGRNNPDLLDICQFCQTPLKPEAVLRSGEKPTKKNTGELESVLPEWLKDVRQQAKDAAEEQEAAQAAADSKVQKNEPLDLLAGLASQAGRGDEEDVPDWLASINPGARPTPSTPPVSAAESGSDFFAQFNQPESKAEPVSQPSQEQAPSWMDGMRDTSPAPQEKDELSEWFTQASGKPEEIIESEGEQGDLGWGSISDLHSGSGEKSTTEPEDLSWLHNLEAASKQTGDLQTPKKETGWMAEFEAPATPSQPTSSQEDLSWLDRLGGIEDASQPAPESSSTSQEDLDWLRRQAEFGGKPESAGTSQPAAPDAASQEDLSWLSNLGAAHESQPVDAAPNQPIPPKPFATEEDLDWINKLGGTSEPAQPANPFSVSEEIQPSAEDLSWLNNLGKPSEPPAPAASQPDLSWLNDLGGEPEPLATPPFAPSEDEKVSPRQTAPLTSKAAEETEPDWLKSAAEAPSMPAPGDLSMDWFSGSGQAEPEKTPPPAPQTIPFESDIFSSTEESTPLSNQDVDSLFSVEMPDWLSRPEQGAGEPVSQQTGTPSSEGDESLSPVDLPSWVQAMRPVEAVITETAPSVSSQPAETEGPLAGLHGVIPMAAIGSSRRPKPVSLMLQASDEQQASAVLLEQILGSETSPRALITSSVVTSQQWLRWALTGLFLLVLSAGILLGSQTMPVSANLPTRVSAVSNAVIAIPANSKVLVVIDYEPSLAGEMEAVGGPLLDQIVLLSQPTLSFVSTSPNGAALAERLLVNTRINQAGLPYLNLGYLPGGAAGILGFIEAPGQIIPLSGVGSFSEYSALVVLTDHAQSGRVWVEQLQNRKTVDPVLTNQPLLMVASAQAGPLLQPYVDSRQITGMISGLADAARYELLNNSRPGIARSYWDTFGIGLMTSVALIVIGSLWSLFNGMRSRANAEQG
jgi:hypothetical protein